MEPRLASDTKYVLSYRVIQLTLHFIAKRSPCSPANFADLFAPQIDESYNFWANDVTQELHPWPGFASRDDIFFNQSTDVPWAQHSFDSIQDDALRFPPEANILDSPFNSNIGPPLNPGVLKQPLSGFISPLTQDI